MQRISSILFAILTWASVLTACSASSTQISPTPMPTQAIVSGNAITAGELPRTEKDIPRVSVEEARTAFESGAAVIVDVRTSGVYETSHIAGAISIPLGDIETDLSTLTLDKEQWIITYCT